MRPGEIALLTMLVVGLVLCFIPVPEEPAPSASAPAVSPGAQALVPSTQVSPPPGESVSGPGEVTLDAYGFDRQLATRVKLPERLEEISGLALTQDGRLLAHDDERGTVFEIDPQTGAIVKSFDLAGRKGAVTGDFEGIAAAGDHVYLVTGDAHLYEAREGGDEEPVPCVVYDTGLGADYEIEGLAYEPRANELLLASKQTRGKSAKGALYIFRWSTETKRIADGEPIEIPVKEIASRIRGKGFNASGIERHPVSGHYFLVAGIQHAIAEVTPEGSLVGVQELSAEWHPQAEGITFGPDQALIISDEGAGKRSHLTLYPRRGGSPGL